MSASSHDRRRGRATFPAPRDAAAISCATAVAWFAASFAGAAPSNEPLIIRSAEIPAPIAIANPTGHDLRGEDYYGGGAFGASRGGGVRRHRGADYISEPGEVVRAPISGRVTRIGFAYRNDRRLRYVEVENGANERAARVFYVGPAVSLGAIVRAGDPIGQAQDLSLRYPRGITNHVHVEMNQGGTLADPATILPPASSDHADTST